MIKSNLFIRIKPAYACFDFSHNALSEPQICCLQQTEFPEITNVKRAILLSKLNLPNAHIHCINYASTNAQQKYTEIQPRVYSDEREILNVLKYKNIN